MPRYLEHQAGAAPGSIQPAGHRASLLWSARAWTANGTPREPRSLKHRPEGAIRTVPIPPQLARLLRWHSTSTGPSPPSAGPPLAHKNPAQTPVIRSAIRPCHSWTQRDTAGPDPSAQIRLGVCDLRKYRPGRSVPWIAAPGGRSGAPVLHKPLTRPDLAHHWPTATGNGLPNRCRTRIRPGIREHRHRV